jgi:hypothetical protein
LKNAINEVSSFGYCLNPVKNPDCYVNATQEEFDQFQAVSNNSVNEIHKKINLLSKEIDKKIEGCNSEANDIYTQTTASYKTNRTVKSEADRMHLLKTKECSSSQVRRDVDAKKKALQELANEWRFYYKIVIHGDVVKRHNLSLVNKINTQKRLIPEVQSCKNILYKNIFVGSKVDSSEISRLQIFLNKSEASNIEVNGKFDIHTLNAVKLFQEKYSSEILSPFGLLKPTGNVYSATRSKINSLNCKLVNPTTLVGS